MTSLAKNMVPFHSNGRSRTCNQRKIWSGVRAAARRRAVVLLHCIIRKKSSTLKLPGSGDGPNQSSEGGHAAHLFRIPNIFGVVENQPFAPMASGPPRVTPRAPRGPWLARPSARRACPPTVPYPTIQVICPGMPHGHSTCTPLGLLASSSVALQRCNTAAVQFATK